MVRKAVGIICKIYSAFVQRDKLHKHWILTVIPKTDRITMLLKLVWVWKKCSMSVDITLVQISNWEVIKVS